MTTAGVPPAEDGPTPAEVWAAALALLDRAGTWEELRGDLDRQGHLARLSGDQRQALAERWDRREVARLDDAALIADLTHWAEGRGQAAHPLGFRAPKPEALVAEARARGWFVRDLPGERVVVSPPQGKPLVLSRLA